jgi:hypothetical protein
LTKGIKSKAIWGKIDQALPPQSILAEFSFRTGPRIVVVVCIFFKQKNKLYIFLTFVIVGLILSLLGLVCLLVAVLVFLCGGQKQGAGGSRGDCDSSIDRFFHVKLKEEQDCIKPVSVTVHNGEVLLKKGKNVQKRKKKFFLKGKSEIGG